MPAYVLYDRASGRVLAMHHEVVADGETTAELDESEILAAVGESVVAGVDYGIAEVDERPRVRRGYRLYVDPGTEQLVELEVT